MQSVPPACVMVNVRPAMVIVPTRGTGEKLSPTMALPHSRSNPWCARCPKQPACGIPGASASPALDLSIQLRQRNNLIGIRINLRVASQRFGNAFIFVEQNAGKRLEKIRRQSRSFLFGQAERELLYFNYCGHVRRIPLWVPLEQQLLARQGCVFGPALCGSREPPNERNTSQSFADSRQRSMGVNEYHSAHSSPTSCSAEIIFM